jgi:hypothetical protein
MKENEIKNYFELGLVGEDNLELGIASPGDEIDDLL